MSASFHNSQQQNNKNWKFYKLPEILAENSTIPGNSRREFLTWHIPGNSRWPWSDAENECEWMLAISQPCRHATANHCSPSRPACPGCWGWKAQKEMWNFRSRERKFHTMVLSLPGAKVLRSESSCYQT